MARGCDLPPELIDRIIDFLHLDVKSLARCSLVARSWISASQFHLFSDIETTSSKLVNHAPQFFQSHSRIAGLVRDISISAYPKALIYADDLLDILALLPSLHTIRLEDVMIEGLDRETDFSWHRDGLRLLAISFEDVGLKMLVDTISFFARIPTAMARICSRRQFDFDLPSLNFLDDVFLPSSWEVGTLFIDPCPCPEIFDILSRPLSAAHLHTLDVGELDQGKTQEGCTPDCHLGRRCKEWL